MDEGGWGACFRLVESHDGLARMVYGPILMIEDKNSLGPQFLPL